MTTRERYAPGAAFGARIEKNEETEWTLVLVRDLRHAPAKVWAALTDPAQLREWAPFDSDVNLGTAGTSAKLTTVGAPKPFVSETKVTKADAPRALELTWGGSDLRWELEPLGTGTRLTLWTNINKGFIAMGATGWHIAFDVLDRLLDGSPLGRIAGPAAMALPDFQRLHLEYASQLGVTPAKF
ncbi:MAG: SRPBCC domain-containing protein [Myxococcaceae bacterium]|nr:SRPBCC domain-containing protein [Myxococcaceae bacterium]